MRTPPNTTKPPTPSPRRLSPGVVRWLRDCRGDWAQVRNPATLATARALSEQIEHWIADSGPQPDTSMVIAALRCGGSTVPIWACGVMSTVCDAQEDPTGYALGVFKASTSPARGWMMRYFCGPEAAAKAIIEAGLRDRSARVREWACEGADSKCATQFVPILETLAASDPHPDVRAAAADSASVLTRGYTANLTNDGEWMIRLGAGGDYTYEWVGADVVASLGMNEVVRLLKSDPDNPLLRLDPDRPTFGGAVARP